MAEPMRIMLVVNEYPPQKFAGTAMATQGLAQALAGRGHQVCVVVTTTHAEAVNGEVSPGLCVYWMPDRPFRGAGILWRLFHLLRRARQWRPDVMQGQAVSCGLLVGLAGRILGIPGIAYAQGMDVFSAGRLQAKSELTWACRSATRVVAVTQHLAERLTQVTGYADVGVLGHGFVPRRNSRPREAIRLETGCPEGVPAVLHVGRMDANDKDKGQDILLEAWAGVAREMPRARLWLVGDGSWRAELDQQAAALGITGSVIFLGFRPPEQVADFMHAADLFVLPSRYEPYGLVLLEAMYHRLPLVATRVGGVPEVIAPDGDVLLCEGSQPQPLAETILAALENKRYPSSVNHAWAAHFAWPEHVLRFEALYRSMPGLRMDGERS